MGLSEQQWEVPGGGGRLAADRGHEELRAKVASLLTVYIAVCWISVLARDRSPRGSSWQ